MATNTVTLRVTRKKGNYEVAYLAGPPDWKGIAVTNTVKADAFDPEVIAGVLADRKHSIAELEACGDRIGAAFFSGKAGKAWLGQRKETVDAYRAWNIGGTGEPPLLRTLLALGKSGLEELPWESTRLDGDLLFFSSIHPVARVPDGPLPKPKTLNEWPVRILAVIGADDGTLETRQEVWNLRRQLRMQDHIFDFDVFDCAGDTNGLSVLEALKERLGKWKPHVLHFAGHADFAASALQIDRQGTPGDWWQARQIGEFVGTKKLSLRLVFLNACRTARPVGAGNSFVGAFLETGNALATITMCADIRGADAAKFSSAVYREMALGKPIDQAVADARAGIGSAEVSTYYPIVNTCVDAGEVVLTSCPAVLPLEAQVTQFDGRAEVKRFVNRYSEKRSVLEEIARMKPEPDKGINPAVLVLGNKDKGKSWFLYACARCMARQGFPVIYADLKKYTTWDGLLRSLALDGGDWDLAPRLEAEVLKDLDLSAGSVDELPGKASGTLKALETLSTKDRPLVLMLDHIATGERHTGLTTDFEVALSLFFDPIARGEVNVRLVVTCADETVYQDRKLRGGWTSVRLQPFARHDVSDYVREMLSAWDLTADQLSKQNSVIGLKWDQDVPLKSLLRVRDLALDNLGIDFSE